MENKVKQKIHNKVILITGGTGSFGNSMIKALLTLTPKKIIVYSRDEKKQFDMRNEYNNKLIKFIIGDVRDKDRLTQIMKGVDYVFHAAALKQVPTCEFFPMEAVKTNILGAHNVLRIAIDSGVEKVVILSTDKAVYPINAMGMSKALMEKCMIAESRNITGKQTVLCGVRYGNVLYSRGSVIPRFIEEIRKGSPLTITNPDMTRFLLPLKEAVDLVLHAFVAGENGCLYVRKAPAATIKILAEAVCKIFSHKKGLKEVGIRNGEKIHETLVSKEEIIRAQDQGNYFKIIPESQDLDYNQYFYRGKIIDQETVKSYTSENTYRLNVEETVKLLKKLPEIQQQLKNK